MSSILLLWETRLRKRSRTRSLQESLSLRQLSVFFIVGQCSFRRDAVGVRFRFCLLHCQTDSHHSLPHPRQTQSQQFCCYCCYFAFCTLPWFVFDPELLHTVDHGVAESLGSANRTRQSTHFCSATQRLAR